MGVTWPNLDRTGSQHNGAGTPDQGLYASDTETLVLGSWTYLGMVSFGRNTVGPNLNSSKPDFARLSGVSTGRFGCEMSCNSDQRQAVEKQLRHDAVKAMTQENANRVAPIIIDQIHGGKTYLYIASQLNGLAVPTARGGLGYAGTVRNYRKGLQNTQVA